MLSTIYFYPFTTFSCNFSRNPFSIHEYFNARPFFNIFSNRIQVVKLFKTYNQSVLRVSLTKKIFDNFVEFFAMISNIGSIS